MTGLLLDLLRLSPQLAEPGYREPWQKVVFLDTLAERLVARPEIDAVGALGNEPFTGDNLSMT